MKKLIAIISAALAFAVYSAPMASQNWVSNRVNEAKFEMDARTDLKLQDALRTLDRAIELLGAYSPELTNDTQYVSRSGTNECYLISSFADTNFVDKLVAWDKVSDKPRNYYNADLDFHIYVYEDFNEVSVRTNTFSSSITKMVSAPVDEIVSVTNDIPVTSYQSTPIWVPESTIEQVYTYEIDGVVHYTTNTVVVPAYISGYDTTLVTNSLAQQINTYTNTTYEYSLVTNTTQYVKIYVTTNTYNKVWGQKGDAIYPSLNNLLNWRLSSPTGEEMIIYKYDCNDAEWYRALHGE